MRLAIGPAQARLVTITGHEERPAMTDYDAIVVGARVAGSPTAMLLARLGYRVLLVDRATFPSDTISTHLIHAPGMAALGRWGLADRVAGTGCPPISTYRLDFGPFAIAGRPRTVAGEVALAPRRVVLDQLLLTAAAEAGVEVRESVTVDDLLEEDGIIRGIRGRTTSGLPVEERARVVIGADGVHSTVARRVGAARYHEAPAAAALYLAYWSDLPTGGEFQMFARERRAIAAVPTNDGLTAALVAWPIDEFEANRRDLVGNYLRAFEAEPTFAQRIQEARRVSQPVGAVMHQFYRRSHGPGWVLVGDAGYHKDAVTAQGISDAFRDAETVAGALDEVLGGRRTFDEALSEREDERDRRTGPMYELTTQFASMEPPTDETAQLFAAIAADEQASEDFVSMFAGTLPVEAFFDPARIQGYSAAPA
jgi:2-polyprenyl-6-methoxyphenol hydroxylase-like FAD-dependent oxidoreductase